MVHFLRISFLSLLFCLSQMLQAQTSLTIGYCPNELSRDAQVAVLSDVASYSMQAAIKIPGARLMALKGATLTKIRFAANAGMTTTYVWVRPSIEDPGTLSLTRLGTTTEGWNEVTLSKPYTITGEDIYVGYQGTMPAGKGFYFDGQENPNACYYGNGVAWNDAYGEALGSLCIQAIIEADASISADDVAVEGCTFDTKFAKVDSATQATFAIGNYGATTVDVPRLFYQLGNNAQVEVPTSGSLAPGESQEFSAIVSTANAVEGYNELRVWIEASDSYEANNTYEAQLCCYKDAYPHKVLVEHFTTLPCVNCPQGHKVLQSLLSNRSDYVWVAHHVGYREDELTVQDSYSLSSPLGVNGAPYAALDRTVLPISESKKAAALGIGYSSANTGVSIISPYLDQCAQVPAFVSVNIENSYDATTRQLTTTVSGTRTALLSLFYPENCLTVQLVEDNVQTVQAQTGDGEKVHSNVYRQSLTDVTGEAIAWSNDAYSRTFTCTLPDAWQTENLRVVAFVNRPVSSDGTQLEVLNANQLAVTESSTTGINHASSDAAPVVSREFFNLAGQRIAAPQQGVYLERITTTQSVTTYKRVR